MIWFVATNIWQVTHEPATVVTTRVCLVRHFSSTKGCLHSDHVLSLAGAALATIVTSNYRPDQAVDSYQIVRQEAGGNTATVAVQAVGLSGATSQVLSLAGVWGAEGASIAPGTYTLQTNYGTNSTLSYRLVIEPPPAPSPAATPRPAAGATSTEQPLAPGSHQGTGAIPHRTGTPVPTRTALVSRRPRATAKASPLPVLGRPTPAASLVPPSRPTPAASPVPPSRPIPTVTRTSTATTTPSPLPTWTPSATPIPTATGTPVPPSTSTPTPTVPPRPTATPVTYAVVGATGGQGVNARRAPGLTAIVAALPDGTIVQHTGRHARTGGALWTQVVLPSGTVAWIDQRYLVPYHRYVPPWCRAPHGGSVRQRATTCHR